MGGAAKGFNPYVNHLTLHACDTHASSNFIEGVLVNR